MMYALSNLCDITRIILSVETLPLTNSRRKITVNKWPKMPPTQKQKKKKLDHKNKGTKSTTKKAYAVIMEEEEHSTPGREKRGARRKWWRVQGRGGHGRPTLQGRPHTESPQWAARARLYYVTRLQFFLRLSFVFANSSKQVWLNICVLSRQHIIWGKVPRQRHD